jgi:hypothetical protein
MQQTCDFRSGVREYLQGEAMPGGSTAEVEGHVDRLAAQQPQDRKGNPMNLIEHIKLKHIWVCN